MAEPIADGKLVHVVENKTVINRIDVILPDGYVVWSDHWNDDKFKSGALSRSNYAADKINAAHRAEVRKELVAFKKECSKTAESLYDQTYWDDPSTGISATIEKIDIDAFMERER
jgi:hypothetical protein